MQFTAALAQSAAASALPATRTSPSDDGQLWSKLTSEQQLALAPLSGTWESLSPDQRRKWIALSRTYPKMPADEQARLHSRMRNWAAMTPAERTQARLNFTETRTLKSQEKKAQWEAYQALPAEQKKALGQGSVSRPAGVSTAVDGSPKQKLVRTQQPSAAASSPSGKAHKHAPVRAVVPHDSLDANTLLPQPTDSTVRHKP